MSETTNAGAMHFPVCRTFVGHMAAWLLVLGLAGAALWSLRDFTFATIWEDARQDRLDKAMPPLGGSHSVGQTFVARENGLAAVDVLLVVYGQGDRPVAPAGQLIFHLRESPTAPVDLATVVVETAGLAHNDRYRFAFPAQRESRGGTYAFLLEGTSGSQVSIWSSSLDAYADGAMLMDGQPTNGDLYFITYYQSNPWLVLGDVLPALTRDGWLALPFLLLFVLPGAGMVSLLGPAAPEDPLSQLALAVGLSLAAWPVVLLWLTAAGGRLDTHSAWLVVGALAALALTLGMRQRFRGLRAWLAPQHRWSALALLVVLAAITLVRFLQVRGLVLPPWVDSIHHSVITHLVMENGGIPSSYQPFLPIDTFKYHCGFHVDAALFTWLTGRPVEDVLLTLGQALNVATSLAAYLLTVRLTRRRLAGLVAALVVGLIASMPAYYVSWGRYTQLTGLVILPTALTLLLEAMESERRKRWGLLLGLMTLALGGLFLTHIRVAAFGATFALPALVVYSFRDRRSWWTALQPWVIVSLAVLGTALVTLPWLDVILLPLLQQGTLLNNVQGAPGDNAFPWTYLTTGYNRELLALAGGGLLWGLWRQQRSVLLIALWAGLTLLIANLDQLGFPSLWLFENSAVAISFFLPTAALVGFLAADLAELLQPLLGRWGQVVVPGVAALGLAVAGLWGARAMLPIVNPVTVLATEDDIAAYAWIREHTPPTARFLVNARPWWQQYTYAGTDGGYWLPLLTDRQGTLPPALYTWGTPDYIRKVNDLAEWASTVESFDAPATWERLRQEGITHIYIGARGGHITPQKLLGVAGYRPIYSRGPVWIFAVEEP